MTFLDQMFEEMFKDNPPQGWRVEPCYSPEPVNVLFDYHPATHINMRMLGSRGSGTGISRQAVIHAIADRDIPLKRTIRFTGSPLCGAKHKYSSDWFSTHDAVSCPKCEKTLQQYSLLQSIRPKTGAWT